jgi:hypothetical protein
MAGTTGLEPAASAVTECPALFSGCIRNDLEYFLSMKFGAILQSTIIAEYP